jgi:hypothetical protein
MTMNFTIIHVFLRLQAGLLTSNHRLYIPSQFPSGIRVATPLYSGGSVRDSHPVPYSPLPKRAPAIFSIVKIF